MPRNRITNSLDLQQLMARYEFNLALKLQPDCLVQNETFCAILT